jgi:excisionase family DNA binding protein
MAQRGTVERMTRLWTASRGNAGADGTLGRSGPPGGPPDDSRAEVTVPPRFLQLADVAEVLNISASQAYALVRSGELPAIKVGGRGQWRVEASELEAYIQRCYAQTKAFVDAHPLTREQLEQPPVD